MGFTEARVPDDKWLKTIERWLDDSKTVVIVYTLANAGGTGGYCLCNNMDDVHALMRQAPIAARLQAYPCLRVLATGVVDDAFVRDAVSSFEHADKDFLVLDLPKEQGVPGYAGVTGRNSEELEDYLQDRLGQSVMVCLDPSDTVDGKDEMRVYVGGRRGAY